MIAQDIYPARSVRKDRVLNINLPKFSKLNNIFLGGVVHETISTVRFFSNNRSFSESVRGKEKRKCNHY